MKEVRTHGLLLVAIFRGQSLRGQGTGGARNPNVIVRIFIFIFLRLKVVLQIKPCKGGQ